MSFRAKSQNPDFVEQTRAKSLSPKFFDREQVKKGGSKTRLISAPPRETPLRQIAVAMTGTKQQSERSRVQSPEFLGVCVEKNGPSFEALPEAAALPGMRSVAVLRRNGIVRSDFDWLAEEVPVALVYNGVSHVVMMATPQELSLLALGFSLAEGIVASPQDIYDIEEQQGPSGIEVHIELAGRAFEALKQRRRNLVGRTGCGVCGTEQIEDVCRPLPTLPFTQRFPLAALDLGLAQLHDQQKLGQQTGCTHAAAWLSPTGTVLGLCEDVGRHVALDKLLGLRARKGWQDGAALVTSRASYEMVQKAAQCGVEILFAVSAATSLAVDTAIRYGVSLVGFSRLGRATLYTHPERLDGSDAPQISKKMNRKASEVRNHVSENCFTRKREEG